MSKSKFDECVGEQLTSGVEFEDVEVEEVYDETIDSPQIGTVESKAVTLTLAVRAGTEEQRDTDMYHLVPVDGRWTWILEADDVEAYQHGECPT